MKSGRNYYLPKVRAMSGDVDQHGGETERELVAEEDLLSDQGRSDFFLSANEDTLCTVWVSALCFSATPRQSHRRILRQKGGAVTAGRIDRRGAAAA